ncbi:MAG: redox-sensing transcriptional repressor Rex [Chitinispirillales bacterium]|nr:redox-sensing transcriptional repressor Rex [Chitinispirillales bacterium]
MAKKIPIPAVSRLCAIYRLLDDLSAQGTAFVSSGALGEMLGVGAHNIRKDISYLLETAGVSAKNGYDVKRLKEQISRALGFDTEGRACIVGLGRLGLAILREELFFNDNVRVVAGFDSNINLVETIKADIGVYPSFEMTDVVKRLNVKLAILTVPSQNAQECANRLVQGGVKGIVNFTSAVIKTEPFVKVRNVDLTGELKILSALASLDELNNLT